MEKDLVRVEVRLNADDLAALKRRARNVGCTVSVLVRMIVRQHLEGK